MKKNAKENTDRIVIAVTVLISLIYIYFGHRRRKPGMEILAQRYATSRPVKLQVLSVEDEHYEKTMYPDFESPDQVVLFTAKFTSGLRRGENVWCIQLIDSMYDDYTPRVKEGDRIVAYENRYTEAAGVGYMFSRYQRAGFITVLGLVFAVLLILLGKMKGVRTLISLALTVLAVFTVFIPQALTGGNIYSWCISVCIFIIVMTLLVNNSASLKSASAIVGCTCGVAVAGLLSLAANSLMHMTGFINEESIYLLGIDRTRTMDLRGVMFAGIVFGALGAVMDVAVSLASSLSEIVRKAPRITAGDLFRSGLAIGQDMMGTMSNTLILAYIGSSLSVALLLTAYNSSSLLALFNSEMIRAELLQALAGSIGILLTIPLTSVICSFMYTGMETEKDDKYY